ncbi:DUF5133 domain-containing protein [Streptomyces sp. NPDC001348]
MLIPLRPNPGTLRKLLEEYEELLDRDGGLAPAGSGARAQDLAYTLCVLTGTRDVGAALDTARRHLGVAGIQPEVTVAGAGQL